MTGFESVVNAAKVQKGSSVVVLGTGGVGLSVIQVAIYARARQIIAVDVNPARLKLALEFGATNTILADRKDQGLLDAAKKVKELTESRGADYAVEFMGDGSGYIAHPDADYEWWIMEDVIGCGTDVVPCIDSRTPLFIASCLTGG
ncbi:MAG: zinc-binding dehydrogenase [Pyrinomonadaceae bacterium]|nr:zinc-binding dehydrogenase [Pyrinomonadaceae bacterium]